MRQPPLTIATSLAPTDERNVQPAAIQSWLDHGCRVISVNAADEIAALQPAFSNVEFVAPERTAEPYAGRPVPYIFDLLKTALAHSTRDSAIGITNADIFLRPVEGLADFLVDQSNHGLILGARVDVSDADAFATYQPSDASAYSVGYDFFVMNRQIAADIKDSPFAMGMPFWDYWLPLSCHLAGHRLLALKSPVALHADHATRWDDSVYLFFHALIAYALEQSQPDTESASVADRRLAFFLGVIAHHYGQVLEHGTSGRQGDAPSESDRAALADFYDHFQEAAVHTIKSNAESIRFPGS